MIGLIVTADDLGAGVRRDEGIARAFCEGIVTGASLLPNGPSFASAARLARDLGLPVGVHLNLSEGRSLTGGVPGVTGADGGFPGKAGLRRALEQGLPEPGAVLRELEAQIGRVRDAGLDPDHLDTHQHFVLFPAATGLVLGAARRAGLLALRLPVPAEPPEEDPPGPLGEELALYRRLAPEAARRFREADAKAPEGLWGMPLLDRLTEDSLCRTLTRLPSGCWELMVHPGYAESGNPFSGPPREVELQALVSPTVRELTRRRNIRLARFGDLPCAC